MKRVKNNMPPPQVSRSVRPSLNIDDLILSQNVHQESDNISDPSRGSHVRTQNINIREIFKYTTSRKSNINEW